MEPTTPFFVLARVLLDMVQQTLPVPDTWIDQLSKGSPYILALVIVAIFAKVLVPGWAFNAAVAERDAARKKVDELTDIIFDLMRKAEVRHNDRSPTTASTVRRLHDGTGKRDDEAG